MTNNSIFIDKLRSSGLRPTKQRLKICEVLFDTEKTFHFTVNDLVKIIDEKMNEKISLATVYNTVHAFHKKGYLKEISINSDTKIHHHFYDNNTKELTDISDEQVEKVKINTLLPGKKITSVEVLVRVENK